MRVDVRITDEAAETVRRCLMALDLAGGPILDGRHLYVDTLRMEQVATLIAHLRPGPQLYPPDEARRKTDRICDAAADSIVEQLGWFGIRLPKS